MDFHLFRKRVLETQRRQSIINETAESSKANLDDIAFVCVKEEEDCPSGQQKSTIEVSAVASTSVQATNRPVRKKVKKKVPSDPPPNIQETDAVSVAAAVVAAVVPASTETEKKKYECDKCGRKFDYPSRFVAHYRNAHLKQFERKVCPYCPRAFTVSSSCKSSPRINPLFIILNYLFFLKEGYNLFNNQQ